MSTGPRLDANATSEPNARSHHASRINYDDGTRYIVALRNMKDGAGR